MEYKPCIYCGRSIRKGSPVDLCINCLQEAKTPEEFIKEIEAAKAMENIDGLIEAGIKKTEKKDGRHPCEIHNH